MSGNGGVGTLFLIPTPLHQDAAGAVAWLAEPESRRIAEVRHFVVETPKVARAWLAHLYPGESLRSFDIRPLPCHASDGQGATADAAVDWSPWLAPLLAGHPVGLLSDAGCPGVADPGAPLVAAAHAAGVPVRPLAGPSAIILALMASGLTGQRFAFNGYLPVDAGARDTAIRELAARARQLDQTQVLIETPYRNQPMAEALIAALPPAAILVIAADLAGATESIERRAVAAWRERRPTLARVPTTFLFGFDARPATGRRAADRVRPPA